MRDCSIDIIVDGSKVNLVNDYDFHLIESPATITAKPGEYDVQKFPEHAAPEVDPRTTLQPFDYKISLGYWGDVEIANGLIRGFFDNLFIQDDSSDVIRAKEIELINNYKGVRMKGFAKPWNEEKYTIQGENGLILFDFVLYVNDPKTLKDVKDI